MLVYTIWGYNVGGKERIRTEVSYDPDDPLFVTFNFHNTDGDEAEWVFSRDLLIEACEEGASGFGDVIFTSDDEILTMTIRSFEGQLAMVQFSRGTFRVFIQEMLKMVPVHEEPLLDFDEIEEYANGI
jgi:hypothetical protein